MTKKIIYKNNQYNFESFKDYCLKNDLLDLLNLWDYDLNGDVTPDNIGAHSTKQKIYFKCPRGLHGSRAIYLNGVCKSPEQARQYDICVGCKSIGQYVIDNYSKDYLDRIWSSKNEKSYFDVYAKSYTKKIWLRCQNNSSHPDYDLSPSNFEKSHNCPYCSGKRVCFENSLANRFEESIRLWSNKNEKTPYDYTYGSTKVVWWKCENNKHDDYQREIDNSSLYNFRCPKCARENQKVLRGEESPLWKGGITPKIKAIRKSKEYNEWRKLVYEKDNYVCQCCGLYGGELRGHHIKNFSEYEDLRFDVNNGITLCKFDHDIIFKNSFHNIYGTYNNTPQQLEEYINNKRKQLGINIPFNIDDYKKRINIITPELAITLHEKKEVV